MFLKCLGFCRWKHASSSESERQYPTVIEELCHRFSLADLKKLTNNFDVNRETGRGGYGIRVYKGCLQHNDGSDYPVAVKRFNGEGSRGWYLFKNEIELLCQLRHPNVISLIGFCNHKNEKTLVFEYMSNGSLNQYLRGGDRDTLSWKKRLEICIGVARGLHYLHAGAKRTIIHRDISLRNILLNDDMEPKLANFVFCLQGARSLSKPKPIRVDCVMGTHGYMAMEYVMHGTVTDKCDVYSFGVVLLKVVCGVNYFIWATEPTEKPVEEEIDANIKGKIAAECWQVFIDIAQSCVKYEADERPTMGEVEVKLEHALWLQEQADITNTNSDYTLLSKTIIEPGVEYQSFRDTPY